jgi:hypothetical protein
LEGFRFLLSHGQYRPGPGFNDHVPHRVQAPRDACHGCKAIAAISEHSTEDGARSHWPGGHSEPPGRQIELSPMIAPFDVGKLRLCDGP